MEVIELNEQELFEKIEQEEGKILVDCYAPWCGPCRMLAPILDELANELHECVIYKINVDNANTFSKKYGIMSIPTVLLFSNKELVSKSVGLKSKEELKELVSN